MNRFHLRMSDCVMLHHQERLHFVVALSKILHVFDGKLIGQLSTIWRIEIPLTKDEVIHLINDELQRMP